MFQIRMLLNQTRYLLKQNCLAYGIKHRISQGLLKEYVDLPIIFITKMTKKYAQTDAAKSFSTVCYGNVPELILKM